MRPWFLGLLLTALPACATAQVDATGAAQPTFDTRTAPGFGNATAALRGYLARAKRVSPRPQHFCVVGYGRGADAHALVHWREGQRLVRWDGGDDPDHPADALRFPRRDLDLRTDVVADDAGVGGSTYLVTRAWVNRVLADCAAHGTRYTLARTPARRGRR